MTNGHTALGRDELGRKWCPRCQTWKLEEEFGKLKREPDGLYRWCRICVNENQNKNYSNDKERGAKRTRNWYANNKEKYKTYVKNMETKNPGIIALYRRNAQAKRRHARVKLSFLELQFRWKEQDGRCEYCGICLEKTKDGKNPRQAQVDHVHPISRGGSHTIDNIVWSCRKCNTSKSNKLLSEWRNENG